MGRVAVHGAGDGRGIEGNRGKGEVGRDAGVVGALVLEVDAGEDEEDCPGFGAEFGVLGAGSLSEGASERPGGPDAAGAVSETDGIVPRLLVEGGEEEEEGDWKAREDDHLRGGVGGEGGGRRA